MDEWKKGHKALAGPRIENKTGGNLCGYRPPLCHFNCLRGYGQEYPVGGT